MAGPPRRPGNSSPLSETGSTRNRRPAIPLRLVTEKPMHAGNWLRRIADLLPSLRTPSAHGGEGERNRPMICYPDGGSVKPARRDGRAAEGARLESVYTLTGIGGSNPSLSAMTKRWSPGPDFLRILRLVAPSGRDQAIDFKGG